MTLEQFASKHNLKLKQFPEDGGASVIDGRQGQIYDGDDERLAVSYMPAAYHAKTWGNFRRAAIAAGMVVQQNGDAEGSLLFDPKSGSQAKMAIKIAAARTKRKISAEHLKKLQEAKKRGVASCDL